MPWDENFSSARDGTVRTRNGTLVDFVALLSFNHVARHGGVSAASQATGQPKATLSRHVRQLEDSLGIRLVERGVNTLRLTENGAALYARTGGLLTEIADAARDIAGSTGQPRGLLRVSVPVLFAHMAVGRMAADFAARYPDVQLEVLAEDRIVDLVAEGYDAVVRVNPRTNPDLVGRCILRDRHVVVAPSTLVFPVDRQGTRATPAVVLCGALDVPAWHLHHEGSILELRPEPVMRVSSLLMVRDAARAGVGAAVLPRSLVADDVADGRLVVWGTASDQDVELWVLHTSRRLVSAKVQAFIEFLCSAFQA